MLNRSSQEPRMILPGMMLLSVAMTIPLYVMMREMSDSLKKIADKLGP